MSDERQGSATSPGQDCDEAAPTERDPRVASDAGHTPPRGTALSVLWWQEGEAAAAASAAAASRAAAAASKEEQNR